MGHQNLTPLKAHYRASERGFPLSRRKLVLVRKYAIFTQKCRVRGVKGGVKLLLICPFPGALLIDDFIFTYNTQKIPGAEAPGKSLFHLHDEPVETGFLQLLHVSFRVCAGTECTHLHAIQSA